MPHARYKYADPLTKEDIDNLENKPPKKCTQYPTFILPGFYIRVYKNGRKKFWLRIDKGEKPQTYTIGEVGIMSLEEATSVARRYLNDAQVAHIPQKRKTLNLSL